MTYKVIKAFDEFEKGDILLETRMNGEIAYECSKTSKEDGYIEEITITVNQDFIDEAIEDGNVIELQEEDESCDCCDKLERVKLLVDTLIETYEEDYKNMVEAFEQGDVQPCVKVEAETVYYNLTKVLNRIKEAINE